MKQKIIEYQREAEESSFPHDFTSEPICPYCGKKVVVDGTDYDLCTHGEFEYSCGRCDNLFSIVVEVRVEYCTKQIDTAIQLKCEAD